MILARASTTLGRDLLHRLVLGLAGTGLLAMGFVLSFLYGALTLDTRPPIVAFTAVGIPRSPIDPAAPFCPTWWREKIRDDCPVSGIRHLTGDDGSFTWLPGSLSEPGGSSTDESFTRCFRLPSELRPSVFYTYHGTISYQCPKLPPFVYRTPPFRFTVAAAPTLYP